MRLAKRNVVTARLMTIHRVLDRIVRGVGALKIRLVRALNQKCAFSLRDANERVAH